MNSGALLDKLLALDTISRESNLVLSKFVQGNRQSYANA